MPQASRAYGAESGRFEEERSRAEQDAALQAVLAGGGEQSRMLQDMLGANTAAYGQQMAQRQQLFGEQMGHADQALANRAQLDAQVAFNNAKLRLDEAELGAKGQPKLSDIATVRKEYTGASGDWVTVRDARGKMQAAFERPSPASDVSMIFGYMKIVDPTTGVKEGEFATAQQTAGIPERIVGLYNRALQGERLTDAQRADFMNQANALTRSQLEQQLRTEKEFGDLAEAYSIPRHHVTPDLIGDLREGLPEIEVPPQLSAGGAGAQLLDQGLEFFGLGGEQATPTQAPPAPRRATDPSSSGGLAQFGVPPVEQREPGREYTIGGRRLLWDGNLWQELQ